MNTPPPRRSRRRLIAWIAAVGVVVLAAGGLALWWFLDDDAPSEVSREEAVRDLTEATVPATVPGEGDGDGAAAPVDTAPATTQGATPQPAPDGVAGTWSVDTSIGTFSFDETSGTFVGFRVEEELAGIGAATAVGRTPAVAGTMTVDGTTVTDVTVEADMTQIVTNDRRRDDRALDALDTGQFPNATFALTQPIELGAGAESGEPVQVTATGELTVHGVTRPVEIPIEAQLVDDVVVVVGSLPVVFADYGVSVPSAPIVVSAEDHGIIELQLYFRR
jgi:polyisoprenoid-binding protein YceI